MQNDWDPFSFFLDFKNQETWNSDVPCQHGWSQNPQQQDVPHIFARTPTDRRSPEHSCHKVFIRNFVYWIEIRI